MRAVTLSRAAMRLGALVALAIAILPVTTHADADLISDDELDQMLEELHTEGGGVDLDAPQNDASPKEVDAPPLHEERAINIAPSSGDWGTYRNTRFGFSIAYPPGFVTLPPSHNGDGQTFQSPDGQAELRAYGSLNIDGKSPRQFKQWLIGTVEGYDRVTYQPDGKDWFVLSGFRGSNIFYEKTVFSCGGVVLNTVSIVYPAAQKAAYDEIVTRTSQSLRPRLGTGNPDCPS